ATAPTHRPSDDHLGPADYGALLTCAILYLGTAIRWEGLRSLPVAGKRRCPGSLQRMESSMTIRPQRLKRAYAALALTTVAGLAFTGCAPTGDGGPVEDTELTMVTFTGGDAGI